MIRVSAVFFLPFAELLDEKRFIAHITDDRGRKDIRLAMKGGRENVKRKQLIIIMFGWGLGLL